MYTIEHCIKNEIRIKCKSEAEANELMKFLEHKDFKWKSGGLPTSGTYWNGRCINYKLYSNKRVSFDQDLDSSDSEMISFKTFKQDNMEKEIIGYKCPSDLYGGLVKAGTVFKSTFFTPTPGSVFVAVDSNYEIINACFELPKEIVETWEPVYKQEDYKVGDWVLLQSSGHAIGSPSFSRVAKLLKYKEPLTKDDHPNAGFYPLYCLFDNDNLYSAHVSTDYIERKATPDEIKAHLIEKAEQKGFVRDTYFTAVRDTNTSDLRNGQPVTQFYPANNAIVGKYCYNEKTDTLLTYGYGVYVVYENGKWAELKNKEKMVSVGGKFHVTIKDNKIYHATSDITEFVKELVAFFSAVEKFDKYGATVKEVIFSRTGCQYVETTLSDWKQVLEEWEQLQQ